MGDEAFREFERRAKDHHVPDEEAFAWESRRFPKADVDALAMEVCRYYRQDAFRPCVLVSWLGYGGMESGWYVSVCRFRNWPLPAITSPDDFMQLQRLVSASAKGWPLVQAVNDLRVTWLKQRNTHWVEEWAAWKVRVRLRVTGRRDDTHV